MPLRWIDFKTCLPQRSGYYWLLFPKENQYGPDQRVRLGRFNKDAYDRDSLESTPHFEWVEFNRSPEQPTHWMYLIKPDAPND